jgi:hypothetical protein
MDDNKTGVKVTVVGAGLLVAASIFSSPIPVVWGALAIINGLIVNEAGKENS